MKRAADGRLMYEPDGQVLWNFLQDRAMVSVIQGPVGSGKSKAANMKAWSIANEQRRDPNGVRRTRWAVVRNTYAELKQTTIRTWMDSFPEAQYGRIKQSVPINQLIRVADVEMEVDFLALDKADDVKKVRSGEYTGFYVNELQYMPKVLFDEMTSRAGRYPAVKDGGCTWYGVIADMNAPEEDHFIAQMTGQVELPLGLAQDEIDSLRWPKDWAFHMQPPGLIADMDGARVVGYLPNPDAENVKWLVEGYYPKQILGKDRGWIDSRVMNVVTVFIEGTPVWPNFRPETHMAKRVLEWNERHPLYVGMDFGRSPAVVVGQAVNSRLNILWEMQGFDQSASVFAPLAIAAMIRQFPGLDFKNVQAYGDPKGDDKGQAEERTAFDIWKACGLRVRPAPVRGNSIKERVEVVSNALGKMVDGQPYFQMSPICRGLKVAMQGKYAYRKGDEGGLEPMKNRHSHIADAAQYLLLGMGEGAVMRGRERAGMLKPIVFNKRRSLRRV